ncbi:hypothetical protein [Collimonas sp. PA-H2]|uniref:hypothetical protein n=1 Tax=Collimonas sp. PA-H2 TaxID=1881062 RepID=UPI00117D18D0|nr:hypothetical protein [Collimonas sp. PA-H2]
MGSSDCPKVDVALAQAARDYGADTTVPSIWFYGDNDKVFAPATWHGMYDSYTAAGGKAELVAFGNFMQDAHRLLALPEGLAIWTGKVDAFLDELGLPSKSIYPEYLPAAYPPSSNYAAIDDVDAVPYLNEQGKEFYRRFLKKPVPRAFVVDPAGFASSFSDSYDPLGKALRSCQQQAQNCWAYAVDDHVVWTRPTLTPAPTHFAALQDVGAVPYLNEAGRRGYQQFLTIRKPRAFVIAPDGGWNAVSLGIDPVAVALQTCSRSHQGCRLYTVDNDVVWSVR